MCLIFNNFQWIIQFLSVSALTSDDKGATKIFKKKLEFSLLMLKHLQLL